MKYANPNAALAALIDEMQGVLNLDGSQRCILRGSVVEYLGPWIKMEPPAISQLNDLPGGGLDS